MKITKEYSAFFSASETVQVKRMGTILEVSKIDRKPFECPIRVLDSKNYIVLNTGEILPFKSNSKGRIEHLNSLYRTFKLIRDVINTNVVKVDNVRWITLTYAENMTDTQRLRSDFIAFNKRLKRFCCKNNFGHYEYINVVEPQARGAWHHHLFLIFDEVAPYISNSDLASLWGNGFVVIKALNNISNPGAYFSAYLSDVTVEEIINDDDFNIITERILIEDKLIDGKKKRVIKGGRLGYYPKGFRIMRASKGVKKPVVTEMKYREIKKEGAGTPSFSKTTSIIDEITGKKVNSYRLEQYNIMQ